VRGAETVPRTSRGYDSGKRLNGRKRHIVTDTCGWLLAVLVTGANVQDRDAGRQLIWILHTVFPTVRLVFADGGYAGKLVDYAATMLGITVQIVSPTGRPGRPRSTAPPLVCRAHLSPGSTAAAVPSETTTAYPSTTPPPSTGQ
jgi:hypothetical protein